MIQIGINWQIGNLEKAFEENATKIKLRGYLPIEPVALPSEFRKIKKALSVSDITSRFCPTGRDLFLSTKKVQGEKTWGRMAGPIIEEYCSGVLKNYRAICKKKLLTYDSIKEYVDNYTDQFFTSNSKKLEQLEKHASDPKDDIKKFRMNLEFTARYELLVLGADLFYTKDLVKKKSLTTRFPILHGDISFDPKEKIVGISSPSTPDILVESLNIVGDVKSGEAFQQFYPLTCAGYAIAFESAFGEGKNIDYGVIYFLETHVSTITPARSYFFLIDDELRQKFFDFRNEAYEIISKSDSNPPKRPPDKEHCRYCKFNVKCSCY